MDSDGEAPRTRKRSSKVPPTTPKAPKIAEKPPEEDPGSKEMSKSREWRPWGDADLALFFDALKAVGKDFEAVKSHMAKSGNKTFHQIRNHYYNTLNKIAPHAPPELNEIGVNKEARELFLLINYGEWRRKGRGGGLGKGSNSDRFKELVLKGSTTIKLLKGHKATLRTPACPSLRRFTDPPPTTTLPQEVSLELVPRTYGDKQWVMECEQNPLVRVQLKPNQPLLPILTTLEAKWVPSKLRLASAQGEDISTLRPSLLLFPGSQLELSSSLIRTGRVGTLSAAVSWERWLQNTGAAVPKPRPPPPRDEHETDSMDSTEAPTQGVEATEDSNEATETGAEMVITADSLRDGISRLNVGNMTAGELALMCSLAPRIRLCYSVRSQLKPPDSEPTEAWKALMTLLRREYGEILSRVATASEAKSPRVLVTRPVKPKPKEPIMVLGPAGPDSVLAENQAFLAQVSQLNSKTPIVCRPIVSAPTVPIQPPQILESTVKTTMITVTPSTSTADPTTSVSAELLTSSASEVEAVAGLIDMSTRAGPVEDVSGSVVGLVRLPDTRSKTPTKIRPTPTDFSILSPSLSRTASIGLRDLGMSNDPAFAEMLSQVAQQDSVDFVKHFQRLVDDQSRPFTSHHHSDSLHTPNKDPH